MQPGPEQTPRPAGPLAGVRVLEFAGLGAAPFCGMLLSDLGAEVLRIDRPGPAGAGPVPEQFDVTGRGRRSAALDLKVPGGVEACLRLAGRADILIEGFRPGVMERLGLGPGLALARNPRLVYGRITGWGRTGPLAQSAGHDINYVALAGALHPIGPADRPTPPLNLVGDYGGGALYLALGVLAALVHARESGAGQVVDAAMVDGAASMTSVFHGLKAAGLWRDEREANLLDGGAPFYATYRCADGRWIAVGALEPKFYAELMERLGMDAAEAPAQHDRQAWPSTKQRMAELIASRSRDDWCALLEGTDACFAPVLSLDEAPRHPHNAVRGTFIELDGVVQPATAPRFSLTPGEVQGPPPQRGADTLAALGDWGLEPDEIAALQAAGALGDPADAAAG